MKPISILLFVLLSLSATAQSQLPYGQVFLPDDAGGSLCPNTLKTIAHDRPHVSWNGALPAFDCTTAGLKYGGTLTGEVGEQSYTAWIVWKRTAVAGDVFVPLARYSTNPKASFIVKRSKANLELMHVTDSGASVVLKMADAWAVNEPVLTAVTFDQDDPGNRTLSFRVIRPGEPTNRPSSLSAIRPNWVLKEITTGIAGGPLREGPPLSFGSRSATQYPIKGVVAGFGIHRSALTNTELQWIYNSGNFRAASEFEFEPVNGEQAGRPVGEGTDHGVVNCQLPELNGEYWCRPFPIPSGEWLWVVSSDHAKKAPRSGCWGQVTPTYDPKEIVNTGWVQLIAGEVQSGERSPDLAIRLHQLETPHYVYDSADPNSRPHHIYAHGIVASSGKRRGVDSGANPQQETHLFTAMDPLGPYIAEGPAIEVAVSPSGLHWSHTGYAHIYPPGSLPGVTDWTALHVLRDGLDLGYGTTHSPDGRTFVINSENTRVIDTWTTTDLLYAETVPHNLVVIGSQVYWVGKARCVNDGARRTSVAIGEMLQDADGRWTNMGDRIWTLINGTGPSPSEGYIHHVRAFVHDGVLHVYAKYGFFRDHGSDHTSYFTFPVMAL